jgi:hypothetical protein
MMKMNALIYKMLSLVLVLLCYMAPVQAQSCFPGCNSLRITFRGGGFTTASNDNNIRICPGQSTVLKLDTSACSGLDFTGLTFQWQYSQFGGSFSSTIPGSPVANRDSIIADREGYYRLIITGASCSTTIDKLRFNSNTYNDIQIELYDLPNISISPSSPSICAGSTTGVNLTASGANSYSWSPTSTLTPNTGIGATVNAKPTINTTYAVTGTESTTGCSSTRNVTVTVVSPPTVNFTFNSGSNNCAPNREVQFTSSCSGSCNGISYDWDFGDNGAGSSSKDPKHKFSSPSKTYDVTLTITNSAGCKSSITKQVTIGAVPDASINDPASETPFKICASGSFDLTVQNASSTTTINSSYKIEWGDGTVYTSSTFDTLVTHTYPDFGFWDLKFTVTSTSGCTSTTTQKVFIGSNPAVGLTSPGSTVGLCLPFTRTFIVDTATTNANPPGTILSAIMMDRQMMYLRIPHRPHSIILLPILLVAPQEV